MYRTSSTHLLAEPAASSLNTTYWDQLYTVHHNDACGSVIFNHYFQAFLST